MITPLLAAALVTVSLWAALPCHSSPVNRNHGGNGILDERTPPCAFYNMYKLDSTVGSQTRFKRRTGRGASIPQVMCDSIIPVPDDVKQSLELSDFYEKYTHAYGIPVIASKHVSDESVKRACYVTQVMLADRKDIRDSVYNTYGRVGIIASTENTTDIPEHSWLDDYYNIRARGLGGTMFAPISTVGEENTLCFKYPEDPYPDEDILVHEFAHGIHRLGIEPIEEKFSDVLMEIYELAMEEGLWNNTYASVNFYEYFAKAVQSYFFVNAVEHIGLDNHVNTRPELKEYDRRLYNLVKYIFPCGNQIIDRCRGAVCEDEIDRKRCKEWAVWGECDNNPKYMTIKCKKTCKRCSFGGRGKPGDKILLNCKYKPLPPLKRNKNKNSEEDNKIDDGSEEKDIHVDENEIHFSSTENEARDSSEEEDNEILVDNNNYESSVRKYTKKKGETKQVFLKKGSDKSKLAFDKTEGTKEETTTVTTTVAPTTTEATTKATTKQPTTEPVESTEAEDPNCVDVHRDCPTWAATGGCESNPAMMLMECKKSCDVCNKPCEDMYPEACADWANAGMCMTALQYMWHYCRQSCGLCNGKGCSDMNVNCGTWANAYHCYTNPTFMGMMCKQSCGLC